MATNPRPPRSAPGPGRPGSRLPRFLLGGAGLLAAPESRRPSAKGAPGRTGPRLGEARPRTIARATRRAGRQDDETVLRFPVPQASLHRGRALARATGARRAAVARGMD